jgi:UDPglucose 6-dehydrogenase
LRISVVGSGYVGLVAAACFAELGHEVISIDSDIQKIELLRHGEVPIHEEFLPQLLEKHRGRTLTFSTDLAGAVRASAAIFIAVGTPSTYQGDADLSYVESVAREIAGAIDSYKLVVEKSTVPVFTSDWIRKTLSLDGVPPELFDVASNPEFLREGSAVSDFFYPDRIVLGADSERAACMLQEIYAPLRDGSFYQSNVLVPPPEEARIPPPFIVTGTKSAELIKHASNAFLALKISFINAVANICEAVGADIREVRDGIGSDSRIGHRFLNPGIGYGGSCFPKDLKGFQAVAREVGCDFRLLEEVMSINEEQRQRFLRKVRNALWTLKGKRVAVLGLAFKGGTDDIRESPAIALVDTLLSEGCEIRAYDPAAMARAEEALPRSPRLAFVQSPYEAAKDADALLILTDWEEFTTLDLGRISDALKRPIVIDGRNLYEPEEMARHGFMYVSIGRPETRPTAQSTGKAVTGSRGAS